MEKDMKTVKRGIHNYAQLWDQRDGKEFLAPQGVDPGYYLKKLDKNDRAIFGPGKPQKQQPKK